MCSKYPGLGVKNILHVLHFAYSLTNGSISEMVSSKPEIFSSIYYIVMVMLAFVFPVLLHRFSISQAASIYDFFIVSLFTFRP